MDYKQALMQITRDWCDKNGFVVTDALIAQLIAEYHRLDLPLSKKEAKKAAQKYNRAARETFGQYQKELRQRMGDLEEVLRECPKWMPMKMWVWLSSMFIDIEKIQNPLKPKDDVVVPEKLSTE